MVLSCPPEIHLEERQHFWCLQRRWSFRVRGKEKNPRNPQQEQGGQLPTSRLTGMRDVEERATTRGGYKGVVFWGLGRFPLRAGRWRNAQREGWVYGEILLMINHEFQRVKLKYLGDWSYEMIIELYESKSLGEEELDQDSQTSGGDRQVEQGMNGLSWWSFRVGDKCQAEGLIPAWVPWWWWVDLR